MIQITAQSSLVKQQLTQALQQTLERDLNMRQRHTYVAQHRRVGQVALQARDRQLRRQMSQDRVSHTQVTLRVLEINRVHLMRHRR